MFREGKTGALNMSQVVMPFLRYQLPESPLFPACLALLTNVF